jgi:hypothetical protein
MYSSGVTEVIAHFIGYLHLSEEALRAHLSYDEFTAHRGRGDEFTAAKPVTNSSAPELEDSSSAYVALDFAPDFLQFKFPFAPYKLYPFDKFTSDAKPAPLPPKVFAPAVNGAVGDAVKSSGEGTDPPPGYSEKIVEVDQQNLLHDNDQFGDPQDGLAELDDIDIQGALASLEHEAAEPHPDHLPAHGSGAADLVAWAITKQDSEPTSGGDGAGVQTLSIGVHVNGEKVSDSPQGSSPAQSPQGDSNDAKDDLSVQPELQVPEYEYGLTGQVAELGGNSASNAALIIDADEMVKSLIVLGDAHELNAIVQTNVYRDNDQVHHAGGSPDAGATIESGGNVADNVAELVAENPAAGFDFPQFTGTELHIDIDEGDFYDVKVLAQRNMIVDNDVSVQTNYQTFSEVVGGNNNAGNASSVYDASLQYDLIIVGGNYYKVNLIGQTNVILDDDVVKVIEDTSEEEASDSAAVSPVVYTGQNWLFNNAKIHDFGKDSFDKLDDHEGVKQFAKSFQDDDADEADHKVPSDFSGHGTGKFNVLYTKGDYYDFNVIWQHNTIVDIDGSMQHLKGSDGWGKGFKQFASTGHNAAQNVAEIIDIGTLQKQFVGGKHYEDSILVQANIVGGNDDKVVYSDTSKLAPEVIAFTGAPDDGGHNDDCTGLDGYAPHHDMLGNLLS